VRHAAFPDGLTLVTGLGQFRGADGVLIEERSMVLILLYPDDARRESHQEDRGDSECLQADLPAGVCLAGRPLLRAGRILTDTDTNCLHDDGTPIPDLGKGATIRDRGAAPRGREGKAELT
jgi:hypothetical protein